MYEAFYGLSEKPFNLTPDPRFLCLSAKHKEAFSHLLYGIMSRSGFIMISGEIGTGKTTVCRYLLSKLDLDTEVAFIFNPTLSPEELLRTINQDFGIETKATSVKDLIDELNAYLLDRYAQGKNCVLVIDEAQDLEPRVLEQIRLLSNLETETAKLLQIILIGQPELAEMLELPELRQLNQRITARYHLLPLNREETMQYIAYRLRIAGARNSVKFSSGALRVIHRFSNGTPRVINAVCDRALLIGFTQETRVFDKALIQQAIHEIRGEWVENKRRRRTYRRLLYPAVAAAAAVAVAVGGPFVASWARTVQDEAAAARVAPGPTVDRRLMLALDEALQEPSAKSPAGKSEQAIGVLEQILTLVHEKSGPLQTSAAAEPKPASVAHAAVRMEGVLEGVEVVDPADIGTLEQPAPWSMAKLAPLAGDMSPVQQTLEAIIHTAKEQAKRVALAEAFPAVDSTVVLASAIRQLLALWECSVESLDVANGALPAIHAAARREGLACETLTLSLEKLAAINLPALVEISLDDQSLWPALVGLTDDTVQLSFQDAQTVTVTHEDFVRHYTRRCAVLWRDAEPEAPLIRTQARGPRVRDLQLQLKALGRYTGPISDVFDDTLASAVRTLQQDAGLHTDGIVGRQTRMVLSSWVTSAPTAWLRPGGAFTVGELAMAVRPPAAEAAIEAPPVAPAPAEPEDVAEDVAADDEPSL
jgi:general secretion pathway protein A